MNNPRQPAQPDKAKLYSDQSARPEMLPPIWDNIPAALRALPQWVAWELRWRAKQSSWAKVPLDVRGVSATDGYARAKSDTPSTWSAFDRVRSAWGRSYGTYTPPNPAGPGFVFKAGGGIVGIDGDKCRNPMTGELTEFGSALVRRFPGYWEVSPSGTGIKGIFYGSLPDIGRGRKVTFPDGQGCEVYDRGRYFAVTGRRLDDATADVTSCAEQLAEFVSQFFPLKGKRASKTGDEASEGGVSRVAGTALPRPNNSSYSQSDRVGPVPTSEKIARARGFLRTIEGAVEFQGGDNATYRAACKLVIDFDLSPNDAFPLLCDWNQTCSPPWDTDWLWRKLNEADKESGPRGERLLTDRRSFGPIGYADITPAEAIEIAKAAPATAAPTLPPEPCPYAAFKDGREWMKSMSARCKDQSPVILATSNMPFVCDRPCGSGKVCRACLMSRVHKSLRESDSYILTYHLTAEHMGPGEPRVILAAILPQNITPATKQWDTLTTRIRLMEGERFSILTDDIKGVAEQLGGGSEAASGFFLKDNTVEEDSRCETTGRLFLLSLPATAVTDDTLSLAGVTFRRPTVGGIVNGLYQAAKSVPYFSPDDASCKVTHKSKNWGNKEEKAPSKIEVVWPSKLPVKEVRRFLNDVEVVVQEVAFDTRNAAQPAVGWVLPPVQSLAICMYLGGVGAPKEGVLTRSIITDLAREVLPRLADVPLSLGRGPCVIATMARIIWNRTDDEATDINAELAKADAFDRITIEAESIRDDLKRAYKGREHEATDLIREFVLNA